MKHAKAAPRRGKGHPRKYRNTAERLCPVCRKAVRADKGTGALLRHKDQSGGKCPGGMHDGCPE